MTTLITKINSIIILCLLFSGCSHSQRIEDYVKRDGNTITVDIPYKVIPELIYNSKTEPFVVCLREEYAEALFDASLHLEHVILRELYADLGNIPIDSLDQYSNTELAEMVESLFKPLFPEGKTIPGQKPPEEKEPFNRHLLKENLRVSYVQRIDPDNEVSEVIEDNKYVWSLKKSDNKWKLYKTRKKQ